MGHMVWKVVLLVAVIKSFSLSFDKCEYIPWNVFWKYIAVNDRYRANHLIKN